MIRVVLADDHGIVRQGVRTLLEEQNDILVVGDCDDSAQALLLVQRLRPDVLVADLTMPDLVGLDLIQRARQSLPSPQVVVLSMHNNVAYVAEALRRGAIGYVVKQADVRELVLAVRAAAHGQRHLSPGIDEAGVREYLRMSSATPIDPLEKLSARERQVLAWVAKGQTNAEIAANLGLSRRTVETHRANMMRKLELESQADVIRFALRRGLLPIET
ncbi:MAG: response regulator transcription factor [Anaerolineae bacterium]